MPRHRIRNNIKTVTGSGGGGGGPASTGPDQHHIFREQPGPSSYPTGGFVVDLSDFYSAINFADLVVKKGARGSLPAVDVVPILDSPGAGQVTFKLMRRRYNRVSAVGNVQSQPAGVTIRSTSGTSSGAESSHTHSIDHDHGSFASAAASAAGAGVLDQLLGVSATTHTHTLDLANLTGTSGAGTSHSHVDNTMYAHSHSITQPATDFVLTEVANATDLSTTTWHMLITGVSL